MEPLLWLLLPVAAASGWASARISSERPSESTEKQSLSSNQNLIKGLNYFLAEDSDKAIHSLVNSLEVTDDTVETHLILGRLFRDRGEVDRAIRVHQNIIARPTLSQSQKENALLQLGIDYFKAGLLDRAENILEKLSSADSKNPLVYEYLCRLYEQEGEWLKAIESSKKLVKYDIKDHRHRVANYFCEEVEDSGFGNTDRALKLLKDALAIDPDCIRALLQQGDVLFFNGNSRDALKSYKKALERNSSFSSIVLLQALKLFRKNNELSRFPDFIKTHSDIDKDAAARYFLISSFELLGERSKVEEMLNSELNRDESSPHIIKKYLSYMASRTEGEVHESFTSLLSVMELRLGTYMACHCTQCGFEANHLFWQCPSCNSWGSVRPYQNPMEYSWLDLQ